MSFVSARSNRACGSEELEKTNFSPASLFGITDRMNPVAGLAEIRKPMKCSQKLSTSWLAQLHQERSIEHREVFESKTIAYFTRVAGILSVFAEKLRPGAG